MFELKKITRKTMKLCTLMITQFLLPRLKGILLVYIHFMSLLNGAMSCHLLSFEKAKTFLYQLNSKNAVNNYSTSARWIWVGYNHLISNKREWNNCFIKNAHKISWNLPTLFVETTDFQLVFEQKRTVTKFGERAIMAQPIRALELHYPMIQFLIIPVTLLKTIFRCWNCFLWSVAIDGY